MRFGSVCSGIEAASQAWKPLGWSPAFFSEIEKFPCAVLARHYGSNLPRESWASNGVPNYGDMSNFEDWPDHGPSGQNSIDVLCGGTPCQSFSIAGLRAGLADKRGNLSLTFGAIARRYRPRWLVWENVPGVLSSDSGRDFASILGLLSGRKVSTPKEGWNKAGIIDGYGAAYGLAWRVLDAQFIRVDRFRRAVPQRRRRVVLIGYLGDWRRAAAVLFERESMCGNTPPRREAGQNPAPTISARPSGGGGLGTDFDLDGGVIAEREVSGTVSSKWAKGSGGPAGDECQNIVAFNSREDPDAYFDRSGPLGASSPQAQAIAIQERAISENPNAGPDGVGVREDGAAYTIEARSVPQAVSLRDWAVRRLTPMECERLQGFPDNFTQIPWREKPAEKCPDGPRYKALGNSWAVNMFVWIGQRIEMVEAIVSAEGEAR